MKSSSEEKRPSEQNISAQQADHDGRRLAPNWKTVDSLEAKPQHPPLEEPLPVSALILWALGCESGKSDQSGPSWPSGAPVPGLPLCECRRRRRRDDSAIRRPLPGRPVHHLECVRSPLEWPPRFVGRRDRHDRLFQSLKAKLIQLCAP